MLLCCGKILLILFLSNVLIISVCADIPNCNHRQCTSLANTTCNWCQGDIDGNQYYRTYTHEISGGETCDSKSYLLTFELKCDS